MILDSRAAVHVKLGQRKDALKDAKMTIDIAPDRWQGYARAARVFLQSNKVDAAQTMVTMALERLKETEVERRASLLALEADIQRVREVLEKHRKRFTNHLGKLPVEVFAEIARSLVDEDHSILISLLHVCKYWRKIIEDSSYLWRKLVLTKRRPKLKAKIWIERSEGKLTELVVKESAVSSKSWPGDSLQGLQWDQLVFCRVEQWDLVPYLYSICRSEAISSWKGLEMNFSYGTIPVLLATLSTNSRSFALQHLSIDSALVDIKKIAVQITGLKNCTLRRCGSITAAWLDLFRANPLLESLELQALNEPLTAEIQTETLELVHLNSLEITTIVPTRIYSIKMPKLRVLKLYHPYHDGNRFIQHLISCGVVHLTDLKLHSCTLHDMTTLLSLLRMSSQLQVLEVTNLTAGIASLIEALAAHNSPSSSGHQYGESSSITNSVLCPNLTHVNFSGCPEVQTGPLIRLVKSRMTFEDPSPGPSDEVQAVKIAKIQSLTINSCPNVDGEWLPRLRAMVPRVHCVYMTRKTKYRRSEI